MPHPTSSAIPAVILIATAMLATPPVGAQLSCATGNACSVSLNAQRTTVYAARLELSAGATSLAVPTPAAFNSPAGINTPNAVTLTVRSNAAHTITVSAATATFAGGTNTKPASSLRFSADNFATAALPVAGTGSALVSAAPATAATLYTIGYNTTYNWLTDPPGTYSLQVRYTLTSP